jgi:hypothetical protein
MNNLSKSLRSDRYNGGSGRNQMRSVAADVVVG